MKREMLMIHFHPRFQECSQYIKTGKEQAMTKRKKNDKQKLQAKYSAET